jgi:hypothetical protein
MSSEARPFSVGPGFLFRPYSIIWKADKPSRSSSIFPTVTREAAVHALEHAKALAVDDDARLAEAVNLGLTASGREDFAGHEKVGKKLKRILRF